MKFHYMGKYSGDPKTLPAGDPVPNAVPFREPKDSKTLGWVASGIALVLLVITGGIFLLRCRGMWNTWGFVLYLLSLVPHEYLHALCFKEDVYMYQNLKQGMLFVIGPEHMSKGRFIFMSLLPNILFGFIPFVLFLINPDLRLIGTLGTLSIASGAGDYLNVFNALTQMPRGSYTYLHEFHSYWYIPDSMTDSFSDQTS